LKIIVIQKIWTLLGGKDNKIKFDITRGEKLEFDVEERNVLHNYADLQELGEFSICCYGLNEILIEKMAALMGRTVPRDLYDFDYLTDVEGMELEDVYYEFERKAKHKGYHPEGFVAKVTDKKKTYEKVWAENLNHQVRDLPKFDDVWRRINQQLRKVEKIKNK
jgi:uncharacterized protein